MGWMLRLDINITLGFIEAKKSLDRGVRFQPFKISKGMMMKKNRFLTSFQGQLKGKAKRDEEMWQSRKTANVQSNAMI